MRRTTLWFWTWSIVLFAAAVVAVDFLGEKLGYGSTIDAEILAGLLGVAAGVLAILFQRRSEFVGSLRTEWTACLEAIAAVRALYVRTAPTEEDYLLAYTGLGAAIDGMRAVYRNHGESKAHVGLYPFATLHDIRLMVDKDFADGLPLSPDACQRRLDQIEGCWRLFRFSFLDELETPEASRPILDRLRRDYRQFGVSLLARWIRRLPERKLLSKEDLDIPKSADSSEHSF